MTIYEQWHDILTKDSNATVGRKGTFTRRQGERVGRSIDWDDYFKNETKAYKDILENKDQIIDGKFYELARRFKMEPYAFMGFLDGISESLNNDLGDLNEITEESDIHLDINFKNLLYNMHKVKAKWLYSLSEWENIFTDEERKQIEDEYHYGRTVRKNKIGRNEPCPCGSGKKFKNCCGKKGATPKFDLEAYQSQAS